MFDLNLMMRLHVNVDESKCKDRNDFGLGMVFDLVVLLAAIVT
jgi:hypothetical protein